MDDRSRKGEDPRPKHERCTTTCWQSTETYKWYDSAAPQILHSKLVIIDDVAYVGSSNLDTRSLNINYELLLRLPIPGMAAEARKVFAEDLSRSQQIHRMTWRKSRTFWGRLRERWAYFFYAKLDPYVARWQLQGMR